VIPETQSRGGEERLPSVNIRIVPNPRTVGSQPVPPQVQRVIANGERARAEVRTWPDCNATPLHDLATLARELGIERLFVKDESNRCGLGAFKSVGGAYAVYRVVADHVRSATGRTPTSRGLMAGQYRDLARTLMVVCASAGNHGRAVAWGARLFGCACRVYLDESVSAQRAGAIAELGAQVHRTRGGYDRAVQQVATDAAANGWTVVSDTAYPGYTEIPSYIMAGYTILVDEIDAVLDDVTHVFVQAGVGGLAGAVCADLWQRRGAARPRFIVVEPEGAACFAASIGRGGPTVVRQPYSIMGGLNCGVVSTLAWDVLEHGADAVVTIDDAAVGPTLTLLAQPHGNDPRIVAGESGCAGVAAVIGTAQNAEARRALGLSETSRVLTIVTEGALAETRRERRTSIRE